MASEHRLRIVHLSDLHERFALQSMTPERRKLVALRAPERHRVLGPKLLEPLRKIRMEAPIDLVCFTGDIADWGLPEEFAAATRRIEPLLDSCGVDRDRIFVVPGNHDVQRRVQLEAWKQVRTLVRDYDARRTLSDFLAGLPPPTSVRRDWREQVLERTSAFWKWVEAVGRPELLPGRSRHGTLGYCVSVPLPGLAAPVYVIGLDSAWSCGKEREEDQDVPCLTKAQIQSLTTDDNGLPLPGLRLALLHHPIEHLVDEREAFPLLCEGVDLLLHGHLHLQRAHRISDPDRTLRAFATGSLYEGDAGDGYPNAFEVVDVFLNDDGRPLRYRLQVWAWSPSGGYWRPANDVYQNATPDGLIELDAATGAIVGAPRPLRFRERDDIDQILLARDFKDPARLREPTSWLQQDHVRLVCIWGRPGIGCTTSVQKLLWELDADPSATAQKGAARTEPPRIAWVTAHEAGKARDPAALVDAVFEALLQLVDDPARRSLRASSNAPDKLVRLVDALEAGSYVLAIDDMDAVLDRDGKVRPEYAPLKEFLGAALKRFSVRLVLSSQRQLNAESMQTRIRQQHLDRGLPEEDAIAFLRERDPGNDLNLRDAPRSELAAIVAKVHGVPKALQYVCDVLQMHPTLTVGELSTRPFGPVTAMDELARLRLDGLTPDERCVATAISLFAWPVPLSRLDTIVPPSARSSARATVDRLLHAGVVHRSSAPHWRRPLPNDRPDTWLSVDALDGDLLQAMLSANVDWPLPTWHRCAAEYYRGETIAPEDMRNDEDAEPDLQAFRHLLEAGDADAAAEVLDRFDYGHINHHKFVARMLLWGRGRTAVANREKLLGKLSPALELRNIGALGWVCRRVGETAKAVRYLENGKALAARDGDPVGRMFVRAELGFLYNDRFARYSDALTELRAVLDEASAMKDRYWEGTAHLGLAYAEFDFGNDGPALDHAQKALSAYRDARRPLRVLDALVRLGMIHRKLKNHERAIQCAEDALRTAREAGSLPWEAEVESAFGFHLRGMGEYPRALAAHRRSLALFRRDAYSIREEAVQRSYLANLLLEVGSLPRAVVQYRKALWLCRSSGMAHEQTWILAGLGIALTRAGVPALGEVLQQRALDAVRSSKNQRSIVLRLTDLAATLLASGRPAQAIASIGEALRLSNEFLRESAPSTLPEAYVKAQYASDTLPHEMQAPGEHQRRGLLLVHAYLAMNQLEEALQVVRAARAPAIQVPLLESEAAVLEGILVQRMSCGDPRPHHAAALTSADGLLALTPTLAPAHLMRGLALLGTAAAAGGTEREQLVDHARHELSHARPILRWRGVYDRVETLLRAMKGADLAAALPPAPVALDAGAWMVLLGENLAADLAPLI